MPVANRVTIDTSDFRSLARALRNGTKALYGALRKRLKNAGELVADDARARAAYSKTIPGTIRTKVRGAGVSVVAGGPGVPIAGLEEFGNKDRTRGFFRHPVFERPVAKGGGGRTLMSHSKRHPELVTPAGLSRRGGVAPWVDQQMRPYLRPAAEAKGREAADEIGRALHDVVGAIRSTPHED